MALCCRRRSHRGDDNNKIITLSIFAFLCYWSTTICIVPATTAFVTTTRSGIMNVELHRRRISNLTSNKILRRNGIIRLTNNNNNNIGRRGVLSPLQSQAQDNDTQKPEKKENPAGLRPDTRIDFGSEVGLEEDEDDLDDEDIQYQKDRINREKVVEKVLNEQDKEFKEERRRQVWGEFADAKSKEDILKVKQSLKEKIDKDNKFKSMLAKQQGVEMEVLEAPESGDGSFFDVDGGNIQIKSGTGGTKWYDGMDEELKQEWAAMDGNKDDDSEVDDELPDGEESAITDTVAINGKIVSRETMKGVRVGSAGGWELEVFPGDFVVHRKYGIGRFERTCSTPRTKLTPEEGKARDDRRKELMTTQLKEMTVGTPQQKIQQIQSKFGTIEDTDTVSNPQVTVLEITYADGIVHVPVDRAYRLSRYRAGDAAVKPRLSKVRGDQWRNARKKVEASTLELAQDVLALYATRETLQRQPFDPDNEGKVKEFEKTFRFEPTSDQNKCFEDVENDMVWRSRPMDRLICGDVG
jgi:transcription-repair coupling factor (superfamily II helicase)